MGAGGFFPANPDLAGILGRTDLNVKIFDVLVFLDPQILDFQVPRFSNFQKSGLGQAWAGPGSEIAGTRPEL